jgi:membrane protein DedA with SNARE-associated domain
MLQRLVALLSSQSLALGFGALFVALLLCGFGVPIPEDVFLVTGGVLARLAAPREHYTFVSMLSDPGLLGMMAVGLAGILAGDSVIFWAGRRLGKRVAEFRLLRHMAPPEKLARVEKLLRKRGPVVVMIARFLPGLRAPTFFTVGHSRVPYRTFLAYDGLAALVSAPLWVGIGFRFGRHVERAARASSHLSRWTLALVLCVIAVILVRWLWRRRAESRAKRAAATAANGTSAVVDEAVSLSEPSSVAALPETDRAVAVASSVDAKAPARVEVNRG